MVQSVPGVLPFVAETFDPKKFFEMVGMRAMSAENVKKVFKVLDVDGSGFIEEEELKWGTHTDTETHKQTKRRQGQSSRVYTVSSLHTVLSCVTAILLSSILYFYQVCTEGLFQGWQRSDRCGDKSIPRSCRQRWRWQDRHWRWEKESLDSIIKCIIIMKT